MKIQYRLPDDMRDELRSPLGKVLSEDDLVDAIHAGQYGEPLVTVGDVVSASLLARGIEPHLVIFDLITQRGEVDSDVQRRLLRHPVPQTEVESPPACLSAALVSAIRHGLKSPSPSKILVRGEEDLAGLPAILHCPPGGTVIYGMPNEGLVPVPVSEESKTRAQDLLTLMKVEDAPVERV